MPSFRLTVLFLCLLNYIGIHADLSVFKTNENKTNYCLQCGIFGPSSRIDFLLEICFPLPNWRSRKRWDCTRKNLPATLLRALSPRPASLLLLRKMPQSSVACATATNCKRSLPQPANGTCDCDGQKQKRSRESLESETNNARRRDGAPPSSLAHFFLTDGSSLIDIDGAEQSDDRVAAVSYRGFPGTKERTVGGIDANARARPA